MQNILSIETITPERFAPYGHVIAFPAHPADERYEVVVTEAEKPWRIAVFRVKIRSTSRLECHPTSMESFEPMAGTGVLLCAEPDRPEDVHAFLLDQPVCLHKHVWHEVITLSDEALYKITENDDVYSEFHDYPAAFRAGIVTE